MNIENTPKENLDATSRQADVIGSGIRLFVLAQAAAALFSSIVWFVKDDLDKWFTRWALGVLLLSAWGIMKHLSRRYNQH